MKALLILIAIIAVFYAPLGSILPKLEISTSRKPSCRKAGDPDGAKDPKMRG